MNKQDIIKSVSKDLGLSQAMAEYHIKVILNTFVEGAEAEGKAVFSPWKFFKKTSSARNCRNPKTGEAIVVPERSRIALKIFGD